MPDVPAARLRRRAIHHAKSIVQLAAFATVIASARASLADHYVVPSGSMEPTLQPGDHLVVDKLAYGVRVPFTHAWITRHEPRRGDVMVLDSPVQELVLVKRLVGLPGDTVAFDGQRLRINGRVVAQIARPDGARVERLPGALHPLFGGADQGPAMTPRVIPQGYYFVLGDHRGDSADSRYWGLVPRANVLGRAVAIAYSPQRALPWSARWWIPLGGDDRAFDARLAR